MSFGPNPPDTYDRQDQVNLRRAIADADAKNLKQGATVKTMRVTNDDTGLVETIKWTNTGWVVA